MRVLTMWMRPSSARLVRKRITEDRALFTGRSQRIVDERADIGLHLEPRAWLDARRECRCRG